MSIGLLNGFQNIRVKKNINEIAPEIKKQLHKLKTSNLKFDLNTDKLEELLENHKRELQKNVVIPKWFFWMVVGVLLASVVNWILVYQA